MLEEKPSPSVHPRLPTLISRCQYSDPHHRHQAPNLLCYCTRYIYSILYLFNLYFLFFLYCKVSLNTLKGATQIKCIIIIAHSYILLYFFVGEMSMLFLCSYVSIGSN